MNISVHPIYTKLFSPENTPATADWEAFKTKPDADDVKLPSQVDFCIHSKANCWQDVAYKVTIVILKIAVFPLILYDGIKYLLGRVLMKFVLPAQRHSKQMIDKYRKAIFQKAPEKFIVRHITLQKDGVNYRGMLVGHRDNILNGNWAIHAVGNNAPVECVIPDYIKPYIETTPGSGYNVLLVNHPNVGRSEGSASPENMANSQQVGISFLESAVRAKKIVLAGHSIGGASIGQAILQHTFKPDVEYRVIRTMTFDTLSRMAELAAGWFGKNLIHWLGYEMDNVAASRKLEENNIPEVIFQAEKDEVMNEASLMDALQKKGITKNKSFHVIPKAEHNYFPHDEIKQILFKDVEQASIKEVRQDKVMSLWERFYKTISRMIISSKNTEVLCN